MAAKVKKNKPSDNHDEEIDVIDKRKDAEKPANAKSDKKKDKAAKEINEKAIKEPPEELQKKQKKKAGKKEGKGIAGKILPIFILLLIIVSLVGILYYNVFDVREKYLRSTIDKIPIVRDLLPASEGVAQDVYSGLSREDLIVRITTLETQLSTEKQSADDLNKKIDLYLKEISDLEVFRNQQLDFKDEKAEFDRMVAEGNPAAYATFFESISPENAEDLYKSAVTEVERSNEVKKYINTIAAMDEKSAARMLEELLVTDMNIVVSIMRGLSTEQSGAILSAMKTENSAAVTKQMSPY